MSSPSAAAGFGLLSATSWGGSDFAGGLGARRAPALLVVVSGHTFTLIVLLAICLGMRLAVPGWTPFFYSAVGGLEGALALALFYRALAMGAMGLTAALCGLLTALIPVLYSMVHEGLPTPMVAAGLVLGLCAIWLITRTPSANEGLRGDTASSGPGRRLGFGSPLLMGALAGVGFGSQLVLLKMAGTVSMLWIMVYVRAAGVAGLLVVLLIAYRKGPAAGLLTGKRSGYLGLGMLAASLDTAGNFFYILASRFGRLDVAAMVCSLYPGGTILLALLILGEKPSRRQVAGIGLALAAVALLSA